MATEHKHSTYNFLAINLTLIYCAENARKYHFTGYERDNESGLDYMGARYRNVELNIPLSTDRFWFKAPNLTPYNFAGNNPVMNIDVNGDSVSFTATNKDLLKQTGDLINKGVGLNVAKIDKKGLLSIKQLKEKQLAKLSDEQKAFYNTMKNAETADGMINIGLVSGSEDVIIGSFELEQIDMADVNALGTGEGINKFSAFGHEIAEQQEKQLNNGSYGYSHLTKGIGAEDKISGYRRGTEDYSGFNSSTGTGQIKTRFNNGKKIVNVFIDVVNGNITKVKRK